MKKINVKTLIFGILIGLSIAGIVVYADTLLGANEVDYTPSNRIIHQVIVTLMYQK